MVQHFTSLDWIVLGIYFAATMCVGLYFWRKSRSTESFTAADGALPGWLVGLSIFATYLSSISYLALPGKAFVGDWNAFVFSLSIPIACAIAVVWFVRYYRESGDVSAYWSLEKRFGPWARVYASVFYLLTQLARIGVVTYLLALPMSVIFQWNIATIIIFTGICVTFYTFVGGIIAVIWTDAIQTLVLLAGSFVAIAVIVWNLDGNLVGSLSYAWENGKFSLGEPGLDADAKGNVTFHFGTSTVLVVLLYGLCDNLKNFGIDQSYIQRYQTARSEKDARNSLWLGAILYLPVSALFFLIGTLLFVLYHTGPDRERDIYEVRQIVAHQKLMQDGTKAQYVVDTATGQRLFSPEYQKLVDAKAASLQDKDIGDRVFPHFIAKYIPPGLTGLLIAAIFSAGMSTISSSLNCSATLILKDFYVRFSRPNASEKESMRVLYFGTILWGALGTGVALLLIRLTDSALDIWWTLVGIFGGGMLGLFLIGMLAKRARSFSAIIAVTIGTLLIFWLTIPDLARWLDRHNAEIAAQQLRSLAEYCGGMSPYHPYMTPVFGTLTMVLIGLLVSFFEPRKKNETAPKQSSP